MPIDETIETSDGSRYPAAASWAAHLLAPRVGRQGQRHTEGFVQTADLDHPDALISGQHDYWAEQAHKRMQQAAIRHPYLHFHVEMRAVALMVERGHTTAQVVLNNVPCGAEANQPPGCHQFLELVLPVGSVLTVMGSCRDGQAFSHTYRGRGPCPR